MNPGDSISRYRILRELGKGGMGVVYQAEDTRLNRPVALKFLPVDGWTEQDKRRFLNEARAAALVRHQNICPIYDIEEADGRVFISMACLEGETLQRRLMYGPLAPGTAMEIAVQIAGGLARAHAAGVVHRDIKSSNIMVSPGGHVSVMDFGLALREGDSRLTALGSTVGTPGYMSPEQARGGAVDARTDVWSLGVLLYEMLTGMLPFRREHPAAVLQAVLTDPLTWPAGQTLDPELRRIVEKALARDPAKRWQSAHEMAEPLKRLAGIVSYYRLPDGNTQPGAAGPGRFGTGGRKRILAGLIATLILALAAGMWLAGRTRTARGSAGQGTARGPRVAVLPFLAIGNAGATRAVADDLVDAVAAALADPGRFQGNLTAVPSAEIRARGIRSAADAHRLYGVELAITGSVQPIPGEKLEFIVTLVDAVRLRQIGTTKFEYDPAGPAASRESAVARIAGLMNLNVTSRAADSAKSGRTPVTQPRER